MQALRTALLARRFVAGFATLHRITVTRKTMLDKTRSVLDAIADRWLEKDWNYALHAYYRSALIA